MKKFRVYIAGPYTSPSKLHNVTNAIHVAEAITTMGMYPYIPHLNHFWESEVGHDYEFWFKQVSSWIEVCDALFRMPGDSPGADREVEIASQLGIPIFYSLPGIAVYRQTLPE